MENRNPSHSLTVALVLGGWFAGVQVLYLLLGALLTLGVWYWVLAAPVTLIVAILPLAIYFSLRQPAAGGGYRKADGGKRG